MPNRKKSEAPDEKLRAPLSRWERKRLNTRRKLIESAQRVMGAKGVEQCTIEEITEGADVGFGTFYNHFRSKEELAQEVFRGNASELQHIADVVTHEEGDPAVALAYIQSIFLTKAVSDPLWGWFIIRTQTSLQQMMDTFGERISSILHSGVSSGRFQLEFVETAVRVSVASLLSTARARLERETGANATEETIESLLRVYGLPCEEAAKVARTPLPAYVLNLRDSRYLEYLFPE